MSVVGAICTVRQRQCTTRIDTTRPPGDRVRRIVSAGPGQHAQVQITDSRRSENLRLRSDNRQFTFISRMIKKVWDTIPPPIPLCVQGKSVARLLACSTVTGIGNTAIGRPSGGGHFSAAGFLCPLPIRPLICDLCAKSSDTAQADTQPTEQCTIRGSIQPLKRVTVSFRDQIRSSLSRFVCVPPAHRTAYMFSRTAWGVPE